MSVHDTDSGSQQRFLSTEVAGAVVLVVATVVAFVQANSGLREAVAGFWHTEAGFFGGAFHFEQSLLHWVDDALMAVFFFVVGLEIKRELLVGELSTVRGAALPLIAAVGGMITPAFIYWLFNPTGPDAVGWGVPMATDIAFALGILALLGSRVPPALKVFVSALAIADDLGAILVIAVFYTSGIRVAWLLAALVPLAGLIVLNRLKVDTSAWYVVLGTVLWFAVLNSGIHATIAGVIAAMTIPATARLTPREFTDACRTTVAEIDGCDIPGEHTLVSNRQQRLALDLARQASLSAAPLQRLEFAILPFTTFVVLPLFALGNAGVSFSGGSIDLVSRLVGGVVFGLVLGKPLGILAASWLAVRFGIASLPSGVTWKHLAGAGMLAGIGFTMSMFVANLAFGAGGHGDDVKVAVLIASVVAGSLGYFTLRAVSAPGPRDRVRP